MFLLPGQSLCHSRNLSSYETRSREAAKAAQTAGQAGQENNKDKGTFKMYSLLNTSPVSNEHTNNDASSSPQHHSVSFLLDTIKEDDHNDSLNQQFSTGLQFVQHDINYDLAQHAVLSPDLVLLDTQSSINIFKNPPILRTSVQPGFQCIPSATGVTKIATLKQCFLALEKFGLIQIPLPTFCALPTLRIHFPSRTYRPSVHSEFMLHLISSSILQEYHQNSTSILHLVLLQMYSET